MSFPQDPLFLLYDLQLYCEDLFVVLIPLFPHIKLDMGRNSERMLVFSLRGQNLALQLFWFFVCFSRYTLVQNSEYLLDISWMWEQKPCWGGKLVCIWCSVIKYLWWLVVVGELKTTKTFNLSAHKSMNFLLSTPLLLWILAETQLLNKCSIK